MAHSEPDDEGRFPPILGDGGSVTTQRRVLGALAVLVGVVVFVVLQAVLGVSIAVALAALGTTGAVFAGGVVLVCHTVGHAVECATGPFCECERCGRPMDDRG
ncbi:hypothetical protein HWV23_04910 [Natronomonas halophila]|uniref:hypothetical protein n=1 Tax=Natronomonas halophila TaxID=2747817 RepID=UPI0015B51AAD|nr:hypothetical protein [Natronomonas halophila]QLD85088.1 hypothetical protein HWV23_04910 [Natronomonas halophila]